MEARPVKTIPIHDHLRGKLCDLYENDCIFDKFECIWGGDDKYVPFVVLPTSWNMRHRHYHCVLTVYHRHVLTGSYHNYFRIYDTDTLNDVVLQADKSAFKAKKIGGPLPGAKAGIKNGPRVGGLRDAMQLETLDFNKKILHASWHPRENTIAVGKTFLSYSSFLTAMRRSLQRIICSCIAPHEFKSRTLTIASVVIIFSTPYALRVSCKIDGFRSKDIYCLSNIMNNKTECELFPSLQVAGVFFFPSWYIYNPRVVHCTPIYTHSLSFQFPTFPFTYLLAPLYQRLIGPHPAFSRCS